MNQIQFKLLIRRFSDGYYKFKILSGEGCQQVLDIIENSQLYFSTADQLNDPLDCLPVFKVRGDLNDPKFIQVLQDEESKIIAQQRLTRQEEADSRMQLGIQVTNLANAFMANVRMEISRDLRLFCLSSTNEHPLLWSHYGNSHAGVCLHFRVANDSVFRLARGVDYSNLDLARAMSLIKADYWHYESEYRILGHVTTDWGYPLKDGRFVSFPSELLIGITLGMCISPTDRSLVKRWAAARAPALAVYEAVENPDEFAIKIVQIA